AGTRPHDGIRHPGGAAARREPRRGRPAGPRRGVAGPGPGRPSRPSPARPFDPSARRRPTNRPAARARTMAACRSSAPAAPPAPGLAYRARDPGAWPGTRGSGLLPAPDGSCQGVFLRYDLFGGRGPAMIIGNLPEGSPARDIPEDEIPFEVGQLLLALDNDEDITVVGTEDVPVMQGDNLLIVRRVKLSESRISCVQFDRSDNVLVTIAAWDRPITD